jgi:hypothetical protein
VNIEPLQLGVWKEVWKEVLAKHKRGVWSQKHPPKHPPKTPPVIPNTETSFFYFNSNHAASPPTMVADKAQPK